MSGKIQFCCDMRGLLSFTILWLLTKKGMYGSEIADGLKLLRGQRPNPGTLYPTLKALEKRRLVESETKGNLRVYQITEVGRAGFEVAHDYFCSCFDDLFREWRKAKEDLEHPRRVRPDQSYARRNRSRN